MQMPLQVPVGYPYGYGYASGSGYYPYPMTGQHFSNVVPNTPGCGNSHYPNVVPNQSSASLSLSNSTTVLTPTPIYYSNQTQIQSQSQPPQTSYYYSPLSSQQSPLPPPTRLEMVCKNYVVHEVSQSQGQTHPPPKPAWKDTMVALFGDDVKWDDVTVFSGKGRPLCTIPSTLAYYSLMLNYFFKPDQSKPVR